MEEGVIFWALAATHTPYPSQYNPNLAPREFALSKHWTEIFKPKMNYDKTQKTLNKILTNNDMKKHFMNRLNDKRNAWNWKMFTLKKRDRCLTSHDVVEIWNGAPYKSKSYILKIAVYFVRVIKIICFFSYLFDTHLIRQTSSFKVHSNFSVNHLLARLFFRWLVVFENITAPDFANMLVNRYLKRSTLPYLG